MRRRRIVLALCMIGALIGGPAGLPALADAQPDLSAPKYSVVESSQPVTMPDGETATKVIRRMLGELQFSAASRDGASVDAGCNWNVSIQTAGYYLAGFLNQAAAWYESEVSCTYGISDFIFNTAHLRFYEQEIGSDTENCDQGYCTYTLAAGTFHCDGGLICSGDYYTDASFSIFLTGGYYWQQPAPPGCTIHSGEQALLCNLTVGPSNVPMTNF